MTPSRCDSTSSELFLTFASGTVILETGIHSLLVEVTRSFKAFIRPKAEPASVRLTVTFTEPAYFVHRNGEEISSSHHLEVIVHHLRHLIIENLISFRPDYLWLHAGGAVHKDRATLIVGSYGSGKSSIVTALYNIGWHYLSDDVVPINMAANTVLPFPLTPFIREDIGRQLPFEQVGHLKKSEVVLVEERFQRGEVSVGTFVFPNYDASESASLHSFSPANSALELFKQCINRKQQGQQALRYLTSLASRIPMVHLTYNNADRAAELIVHHIM